MQGILGVALHVYIRCLMEAMDGARLAANAAASPVFAHYQVADSSFGYDGAGKLSEAWRRGADKLVVAQHT